MAYKNIISAWQDIELSAQEIASVRAIVAGAFKRAGGRGALPSVVSCKNILKGKIAVDAAAFEAGNVTEAPSKIMAKPLSKVTPYEVAPYVEEPDSEGGADNGLAEKVAAIENMLARLISVLPAQAPAPQAKAMKRKAS